MTCNRGSLIVLLLATGACGGAAPAAVRAETPLPSGPAVSFSLPSAAGDLVTVPLPGAKSTVLDFFGPTCEPCAKKVPELLARRSDIEARGGKLVLVAVLADGEGTADAERALTRWGVHSPFLVDRAGVSLKEAGVKDLPSTLVLDAGGSVRWRAPSGATPDDVVRALP